MVSTYVHDINHDCKEKGACHSPEICPAAPFPENKTQIPTLFDVPIAQAHRKSSHDPVSKAGQWSLETSSALPRPNEYLSLAHPKAATACHASSLSTTPVSTKSWSRPADACPSVHSTLICNMATSPRMPLFLRTQVSLCLVSTGQVRISAHASLGRKKRSLAATVILWVGPLSVCIWRFAC